MMEDFSGLALPPLFGGHILEAELEPDGVELGPGEVELGPGGGELLGSGEPGTDEEERRELDKRKYLALSKRCKEIEQVSVPLRLVWYPNVPNPQRLNWHETANQEADSCQLSVWGFKS